MSKKHKGQLYNVMMEFCVSSYILILPCGGIFRLRGFVLVSSFTVLT